MPIPTRRTRQVRKRSRRFAVAASALAVFTPVLAACGGGSSSGPVTINFYNNPGSPEAQQAVVDRCNQQAGGKYRIVWNKLPKDADGQRQQLVRRLAAKDSSLDLLGLDVTWEAEFSEAGWLANWTGDLRSKAEQGVLEGPLKTATYKDNLVAAPWYSNTQLLWYRSDLVPSPPQTWDEMIDMAEQLAKEGKPHYIEVQGAQYEGLTVWFNTLVNSAGGSLLDQAGTGVGLGDPAKEALRIMNRLANSPAADPSLSNSHEDEARLAMEGGQAAFEINYPYVYPSMQENKPKAGGVDIASNFKYAPYPRVTADEPAHVTIGGIDLAVSAYSQHSDLSFEAAQCMTSVESQQIIALQGGQPPVAEELYANPSQEFKENYPFSALIRTQLDDAAVRPLTPAYQSLSTITSYLLSPPAAVDPDKTEAQLRDQLGQTLQSKGLVP